MDSMINFKLIFIFHILKGNFKDSFLTLITFHENINGFDHPSRLLCLKFSSLYISYKKKKSQIFRSKFGTIFSHIIFHTLFNLIS